MVDNVGHFCSALYIDGLLAIFGAGYNLFALVGGFLECARYYVKK
jgi:hypothetical protein